jgi:hypothetical protein
MLELLLQPQMHADTHGFKSSFARYEKQYPLTVGAGIEKRILTIKSTAGKLKICGSLSDRLARKPLMH